MIKKMNRCLRYATLVLFVVLSYAGSVAQGVVSDNVERAALQALYDDTNGAQWSTFARWTQEAINNYPLSTLYGITVTDGDITSISLASANLNGSLSAELNDLTELTFLYLYNNDLSGSLPGLGSLSKLEYLNLGFNDFAGNFPAWIAALTSLEVLDLSSDPSGSAKLSGPLPSTISNLVNLTYLALNYNELSIAGSIPDTFSGLDNLQSLELQGCGLIPASVGSGLSGLSGLRYLNLRSNSAFVMPDGVFPNVLYDLPALEQLVLASDNLQKLPSRFDELTVLNYLDLNSNYFADTTRLSNVVDTLAELPSLTTLILNSCSISRLPSDFDKLTTVENLYLSSNNLIPAECEELGQMAALKKLYVHACNLSELPETLVNLTTLEGLYAWNNHLYPLPETIRDIPNLKELELVSNGIEELPVWFGTGNITSLTRLVLDENQIESFPANFSGLVNLTYLSMASNELSALPAYFTNFTQIKTLILKNNMISTLVSFDTWTSLEWIELQNNQLSGVVPQYLTNATSQKHHVNISFNDYDDADPLAHFTSYPTTVILQENGFTFTDILKLKTTGSYTYSPQDTVDQEKEVYAFIGGTVTLTAVVDTTTTPGSTYQWFKFVNGVNDTEVSAPSTNWELAIPITAADQGNLYYYKIRNSDASSLTLVSRLQTLVITCDVLPTAVNFSSKKYLCAMNFIPTATYPSGCRTKSYDWNFGDGATSVDKSPFHAYGTGGTFTVTLKLRYTCGICVRDTVITKQVTYDPGEDVLSDSVVTMTTDIKSQVIATSAATFSDSWPLRHNTSTDLENAYESGSEGVWRNDALYVYDVPRSISPATDISADGTFTLEHFNWDYAELEAIPHWTKATEMTQYSPFSYDLENRDVLGVYSSALYDYGGHLPSANGVNMRNQEMAFTSFEFLDEKTTGNWIFGNQPLPDYYMYEVYSARSNIAIVKASLAELADADKVDVTSRGMFYAFHPYYRRSNFIKDDEIVCRQLYPDHPEWSMIVLRKSPFPGLWRGEIKVKNQVIPVISADIADTIAHTGKKSLRITTAKTFKQDFLQLDSGKTYLLSAWVSVGNPYVTVAKLADSLGIDVLMKDKNGAVLSKVSLVPGGPIIEGWQQVKGTFTPPAWYAKLELKFRQGSTSTAWYDDLRLHPEKGNMKSYVYDLNDYRLQAILDEENFASFFFYDREGNLHLTQKETTEGIKTISETTSYMQERSN